MTLWRICGARGDGGPPRVGPASDRTPDVFSPSRCEGREGLPGKHMEVPRSGSAQASDRTPDVFSPSRCEGLRVSWAGMRQPAPWLAAPARPAAWCRPAGGSGRSRRLGRQSGRAKTKSPFPPLGRRLSGGQLERDRGPASAPDAGPDRDVQPAVDGVGDGEALHRGGQARLPRARRRS